MRRKRRRQEGMTLIEIMVVLVIMTAMASAVAVGVLHSWNEAKKRDTATRARTLQAVAVSYIFDHSDECPSVADLERGQVLDPTTQHTDGWGHDFAITCDDATVHVKSGGPDGVLGTPDDIGF